MQRWMYFCKYLSHFGYHPVVVTVHPDKASYRHLNEKFEGFIKEVEVHHTSSFEPLRIYSYIKNGNRKEGIPAGNLEKDKQTLFGRMATFIRGNGFIPDARVGWNKFAIRKGAELIAGNEIDCVITTGPPQSTHLVGRKLKQQFPKIKWVADFRDPWSDLYYNKDMMRTTRSQRKDVRLERSVLEDCDVVLTVGPKLGELLRSKTSLGASKFKYIYNGFDHKKMEGIQVIPGEKFEITFIGILTENQPYMSMVEFLKLFLNGKDGADIKLCFAGDIQAEIKQKIADTFGFIDIEFNGYVEHLKSLELMKRSSLLVNCLADMEHNEILISGKQMEYIATGNPILNIGNPNGDAAVLLRGLENAKTFEKDETLEMSRFTRLVYENWKNNEPMQTIADKEFVMSKSRFETTRQLAGLLNEIQ